MEPIYLLEHDQNKLGLLQLSSSWYLPSINSGWVSTVRVLRSSLRYFRSKCLFLIGVSKTGMERRRLRHSDFCLRWDVKRSDDFKHCHLSYCCSPVHRARWCLALVIISVLPSQAPASNPKGRRTPHPRHT